MGTGCSPAVSGTSFQTLDLSRSGPDKSLPITALFDKAEIDGQLAKNSWLTNARSKPEIFKCIFKEADLFEDHFSFHALKEDKGQVRIGVGHGCEKQVGIFTQLDVDLKSKKDLSESLKIAEDQRLLGKFLQKILQ